MFFHSYFKLPEGKITLISLQIIHILAKQTTVVCRENEHETCQIYRVQLIMFCFCFVVCGLKDRPTDICFQSLIPVKILPAEELPKKTYAGDMGQILRPEPKKLDPRWFVLNNLEHRIPMNTYEYLISIQVLEKIICFPHVNGHSWGFPCFLGPADRVKASTPPELLPRLNYSSHPSRAP